MTDDAFRAYGASLDECYQGRGERRGALSRARRRKLRVLEQLERETKEFLRPALAEAGRSVAEDPKHLAGGEKLGTRLAKLSWPELMRVFEPSLVQFVTHFAQSEKLAPPGKERVLQHCTAHERALLEFTKREIEGNRADSLAPVLATLSKEAR